MSSRMPRRNAGVLPPKHSAACTASIGTTSLTTLSHAATSLTITTSVFTAVTNTAVSAATYTNAVCTSMHPL